MPYNISTEKITDVAKLTEKMQRLSPRALAYVEGAVNMALALHEDNDTPKSA